VFHVIQVAQQHRLLSTHVHTLLVKPHTDHHPWAYW